MNLRRAGQGSAGRRVSRSPVCGPLQLLALLAAGLCGESAAAAKTGIQYRVRVLSLEPTQPARICWRWGGEGLGGDVVGGEITAVLPARPEAESGGLLDGATGEPWDNLDDLTLDEKPGTVDRIVEEGKTFDHHYLQPGTWSPWAPATELRFFTTFTLLGHRTGNQLRHCEVEFEFRHGNRILKTFRVLGPDGPTFGVVVPVGAIGSDGSPSREFVEGLGSLRDHARRKIEWLRGQPLGAGRLPQKYALLTDCAGYARGAGYGVRTSDRETMLTEFQVLRELGVNALRGRPDFVDEMMRSRSGLGREFSKMIECHTMGYPVPAARSREGRVFVPPGAGCPFRPETVDAIPAHVEAAVEALVRTARAMPVEQVWGLTVDEIGSVFDAAGEGKAHMGACPHCREAFRAYVRGFGVTLSEFGARGWEQIRSTYGYDAKTYAQAHKEEADARDAGQRALTEEVERRAESLMQEMAWPTGVADLEGRPARPGAPDDEAGDPGDPDDEVIDRGDAAAAAAATPRRRPAGGGLPFDRHGNALLRYYSARFNNEASAGLFEPLAKAIAAENEAKRRALARGDTDSPRARQAWIHSFALRGNTFLLGGHSLDFFDWYRRADNAMVYETSNRDPRVWQWDGYLCDVGRAHTSRLGKQFGIYIKPHRGAPLQRLLAAVSRGATMIFWYTYGPAWHKGDSFSEDRYMLLEIHKAARLLGEAEDVLYGAEWAVPAEVAVVRPLTGKIHGNSAAWENGKWVWTALTHAHIPVDALDEGYLMTEDLSRYKAIYVSGSHLRRDVAEKLAAFVEGGGTLYTSGWGLAGDEAKRPLSVLRAVLGLRSRAPEQLWAEVPRYGGTGLRALKRTATPPPGADEVSGTGPYAGTFRLDAGREVLDPAPGAEVLATYGDGRPAAVRHRYGRGWAYTIGFHAGVEYHTDVLKKGYKEPKTEDVYRPVKRAFIAAPALAAGARPVVDSGDALVEGILLRHPGSGARAVTLANWTFATKHQVIPRENLKIAVRGAGAVKRVRSVALKRDLAFKADGDRVVVELPRIESGDVLLLDR